MACPTCGGREYILVSPGVAQCTGSVNRQTGTHPSGAYGATHIPGPCGHRYQVPNPDPKGAPYCGCGMQAVARCLECLTDVCLDHAYRTAEGILCGRHATERQERAAQAAGRILDAADERLRSLVAQVPTALAHKEPELVVMHLMGTDPDYNYGSCLLSRETLEAVSIGDDCPGDGVGCAVTDIATSGGRFFKKRTGLICHTSAWVLQHRGAGSDDLHGRQRSFSTGVEILAITAGGRLASLTVYSLPIGIQPVRSQGLVPPDRFPAYLQGPGNLAGVDSASYLSLISDRIEFLISSGA